MIFLWGLAFDFVSFRATQYGHNLEYKGMKIKESQDELCTEIIN